ncbi:MAG: mRNA degradation ribonuclease J1/J2 [Candidatus Midichloria mitochondrii]|uniref:Putative hydrolase n=1 Tax=Midichloria mitochondrii (strain IricVA) TaxID=696127 RepID=F7XV05_MIDMI|nr:ribonuclease J [Candidatus Midichloria mitochondrii]AEI88504.1 putative hydrolase [Candidatus Midichloria mitochondrii IricVA]MDJ1256266.1 ribonuclease J [Candidatus Midichloria mitochondrii]MDJ1287963.1 ribonuclease J [Candidatus Midichloria mitochondrii]MDJ1298808.1 ribonuclease J [Candidatus Midichloria mitochondrii]MDJ1313014.1 ribonuclease J [Candidatus Midichloria mitochondrii]
MNLNFKELKKELLFLPLGGSGEVGMNLNVYHYKGKWLIVDMGIGFADNHFPGVEIIVPNINFLIEKRKDIVGILLTHAHEDHIGAVPYLWSEIQIPIYTSNFTATVLKAKLNEHGLSGKAPIHILKNNSKIDIGPFNIELINITHSILENNGIMIRTKAGNIFHTGDWKIDDNPTLGELTDEKRLKELGKEGVLAVIGDSTNIFNEGRSGSEGDLEKSLATLISDCKEGMVVVTTFASNAARLYSIAKAAKKAKRRVTLTGRSLWRMYRAARDCGYLDDIDEFLDEKGIQGLSREEILIISTGCQGEPLAAVSKLANNSHQFLKLIPGDTIIFSSKIIPGNDRKIFDLFNKFCKMGVEVLTERDRFVHVSGHPGQEEVAMMYKYLKPKIAIPVHGEAVHIHAHAKFAKQNGCRYSIEVTNGEVLKLSEEGPEKIGRVEAGYMLIDGESILDGASPVIKSRLKIRDNGAVFVTLNLLAKGKRSEILEAHVSATGLLDKTDDRELIKTIEEEIASLSINNEINSDIEKRVVSFVKKIIKKELNKFPEIAVHIIK